MFSQACVCSQGYMGPGCLPPPRHGIWVPAPLRHTYSLEDLPSPPVLTPIGGHRNSCQRTVACSTHTTRMLFCSEWIHHSEGGKRKILKRPFQKPGAVLRFYLSERCVTSEFIPKYHSGCARFFTFSTYMCQRWIQDYSTRGAPTPRMGRVTYYFGKILIKTK